MYSEELNDILLNAIPNGWANKSYLQGWESKTKTYKENCAMFKQIKIAEQVYEGGTPSKTPIREDTNNDSHVRKRIGGEAASPTNPEKFRT